jgi:hypothetical protein
VIKSGDGEHPEQIKSDGGAQCNPAPADEKHRETAEVQNDEGQNARPFHLVRLGLDGGHILIAKVRIEPLDELDENGFQAAHAKLNVIFFRHPILFDCDFIKHGSLRQGVWMQFFESQNKSRQSGKLNEFNLDRQTEESQGINYQRKLKRWTWS